MRCASAQATDDGVAGYRRAGLDPHFPQAVTRPSRRGLRPALTALVSPVPTSGGLVQRARHELSLTTGPAGTADRAAVDVAAESIVRWPRAGVPTDGLASDLDVRRVPVSRFPYHLAYLVGDDDIHVLAIAHDRRRPTYWSSRVDL